MLSASRGGHRKMLVSRKHVERFATADVKWGGATKPTFNLKRKKKRKNKEKKLF